MLHFWKMLSKSWENLSTYCIKYYVDKYLSKVNNKDTTAMSMIYRYCYSVFIIDLEHAFALRVISQVTLQREWELSGLKR